VFAGVIWKYEQDLPDYSLLKNYEPPVMTRVHAADGSLLAEYSRERRLYLPSDEIPELVKHAFISAEDKNFYSHWGVDPEGIVRAGIIYLQGSRRIQGNGPRCHGCCENEAARLVPPHPSQSGLHSRAGRYPIVNNDG
jgi:penicillin-binding protein 1A